LPTGITAIYGQQLFEIDLPTGWAWDSPTDLVGDAGTRGHIATYRGSVYEQTTGIVDVDVAARPVYVTADDKTKVAGESDPVLTYTVTAPTSVAGLVGGDALSGVLVRDAGEAPGTYAITQGSLTAGGNYTVVFTEGTLTITAAPLPPAPLPTGVTAVYGQQLSAIDLPTGWVWDAPTDLVGSVGTQGHSATFTPFSGSLFSANTGVVDVVVAARPVYVTADNKSKAESAPDPVLTYTVTAPVGATGLVGGDSLTGVLVRDAGETPGTYVIGQGSLSAGSNYVLWFTEGVLTITAAPLPPAVVPTGVTAVYGQQLSDISLPTGWVWDSPTDLVGSVGTQGHAATFTPYLGSLFSANTGVVDVVVSARQVFVRADDTSKVESAPDPALTYTVTPPAGVTGLVGGDTLTGSLVRVAGETPGTYPINQGSLTASGNYTVVFTPGVLVISSAPLPPAPLPTGVTAVYGQQLSAISLPTGWVWDSPTDLVGAVGTQGHGATYVPFSGSLFSANTGTVDVNVSARQVLVAADDKSKTEGDPDPTLTYTVTAPTSTTGLVGGDTLTGVLTRVAGETPGTYAINQGTLTAGSNYVVVFTPGVLTITAGSSVWVLDLPVPVVSLADADRVAQITNEVATSTPTRLAELAPGELARLADAQDQAGVINARAGDVSVSGVEWNIRVVAQVRDESHADHGLIRSLLADHQVVRVYDIWLENTLTGVRFTPPAGSTVGVSLTHESFGALANTHVTSVHDGLTPEVITHSRTGSTVSFEVSHFSLYAVSTPQGVSDPNQPPSGRLPYSGGNTLMLTLLALIALTTGIILKRRHTQH
jgi:Cu/Ag efflux protein CusF